MSPSGFAELRLEGVTRHFGGTSALAGLDLNISRGEFVALLGPSGCGKSTALNCLAGLLALSEGAIWMDERRIDHLPPERRGFGMVFQNYALFPHLSVRENVAFGLQMRHRPGAETRERVTAALDLVQLLEHSEKLPRHLSGGQQQRVAIARALAFAPDVVLMDEPLSNLDANLRVQMRTEIRRIHQQQGLTTVYVTHDQQEALSLADRLVVLKDGRVQQTGTPEEVYAHPSSAYVAGFMGYRNLLDLAVTGVDGPRVRLREGGLSLLGINGQAKPGNRAVAAIRPEDFTIGGEGPNRLEVLVEVVEYQGRELSVEATTPEGTKLHFRTLERVRSGDRVVLGVSPERVLVFGAA